MLKYFATSCRTIFLPNQKISKSKIKTIAPMYINNYKKHGFTGFTGTGFTVNTLSANTQKWSNTLKQFVECWRIED